MHYIIIDNKLIRVNAETPFINAHLLSRDERKVMDEACGQPIDMVQDHLAQVVLKTAPEPMHRFIDFRDFQNMFTIGDDIVF